MDEDEGSAETHRMINYIIMTYESIEEMIAEIDRKHSEYARVSVEKIRYMMSYDQSIKGKIARILRNSNQDEVIEAMNDSIEAVRYQYADTSSMYSRIQRKEKKQVPFWQLWKSRLFQMRNF